MRNATIKPQCFIHVVFFVFQFRQMGRSPSMEKLLVSTPPPYRHRAKEGNHLLISRHPPPKTGAIMQSVPHQQLCQLTPPPKEKAQRQQRQRRLALAPKRLLFSLQHHPAGPTRSQWSDYRPVVHFKSNKSLTLLCFNFQNCKYSVGFVYNAGL